MAIKILIADDRQDLPFMAGAETNRTGYLINRITSTCAETMRIIITSG